MHHVLSVAGAVEAFVANRDLAAETHRAYRKALDPLVEAVGGDQPCNRTRPAACGGCLRGPVGPLCAGNVEHPAGRGAGLRHLVR